MALVGSGAAGVHPPQARAEVGAGRRVLCHFQPTVLRSQKPSLLNPVAAVLQGGLRLRHRRVGQQHPGLRVTVGLQYNRGAVQRLVTESPPGAHPEIARSRDERAGAHAVGTHTLRTHCNSGAKQCVTSRS